MFDSLKQSFTYSILKARDSQSPEVTLPVNQTIQQTMNQSMENARQTYYWVFAIGSMCNRVSLSLRGITPALSQSSKLVDHKLVFRSPAGMADFVSIDQSVDQNSHYDREFHGVLHLLTAPELEVLDRIETGYQRVVHTVQVYQPNSDRLINQAAYAYQMIDQTKPLIPPSERYIDIIARGLMDHSIDRAYIDWLFNRLIVPRTPVEKCKTIKLGMLISQSGNQLSNQLSEQVVRQPVYLTCDELALCDGTNQSINHSLDQLTGGVIRQPLCVAINGKVLLYVGNEAFTQTSNTSVDQSIYQSVQRDLSARDITHLLSLMTYEPIMGINRTLSQLSNQHRLMIEDQMINRSICIHSFDWLCIGYMTDDPFVDLSVEWLNSQFNHRVSQATQSVNQSFTRSHKRRNSLFSSIQANLENLDQTLNQSINRSVNQFGYYLSLIDQHSDQPVEHSLEHSGDKLEDQSLDQSTVQFDRYLNMSPSLVPTDTETDFEEDLID